MILNFEIEENYSNTNQTRNSSPEKLKQCKRLS
jgi:hypothetical protein